MGSKLTVAERNVRAEARAVEAGHRALLLDGGKVKIVSDTYDGKWYVVEFVAHTDGLVSFTCHPEGRNAYRDDHLAASSTPGSVPCMHAATAARRLERERLTAYDEHGRWAITPEALRRIAVRVGAQMPVDLLEGLPR